MTVPDFTKFGGLQRGVGSDGSGDTCPFVAELLNFLLQRPKADLLYLYRVERQDTWTGTA
jgi:hypothetical protein